MIATRVFILVCVITAIADAFTKFGRLPRLTRSVALNANIVETAAAAGSFNTLIAALNAAGLSSTLSGPGPFTVFAPSDEAFSKLPAGTLEGLLKDIPQLKDILLWHVHPGKMSPTRNGKTYDSMLMGSDNFPKQFTIKVTGWSLEQFVITGQPNIAQITACDIKCDNGVIHVVNEVLLPYEGNHAPKVTFIGARDMDGTKTLQQGYYGPEAGTGRNGEIVNSETALAFKAEEFPIGDAWKYGGNWKGGVEGEGHSYTEADEKK